jgi:hypothetical protein
MKLDYDRNKELYQKLKPKKKALFNLYNVETGKYAIFDWDQSKFSAQLEVEIEKSRDKQVSAFAMLKGGRTLSIRVVEDSFAGKKYFKVDRIDFNKRDEIPASVLESAPKLDDLIIETSYARIKELFESVPSKTEEAEEEGFVTKHRAVKEESHVATRIKKAVTVEEDDGVEELPVRKPRPAMEAPSIPPPSAIDSDDSTEEWED